MNIAYSILSAVTNAASAGSAEAASADKWEYILGPVQSAATAEAGVEQSAGVIDRIQALTDTATQTAAQRQLADPDYWGSVGIITLAGILIVFAILAVLIFMFWLMGVIFKAADKSSKSRKSKAEAAKAAASSVAAAPAPAQTEEITEDAGDDEEIMAVISAAIAAYAEEEGVSYTIRNVKRRDTRTRSAWSLAGIGENTRPF